MKTKIIYISGGEVFPPHKVRAAFETVRGMLGLDDDTVIFGVPVDSEDIGVDLSTETLVNTESVAEEAPKADVSRRGEAQAEKKRKKKEKSEGDMNPEPKEDTKTPILSVIGAVQPTKEESQESEVAAPLAVTDEKDQEVEEVSDGEDMLVEAADEDQVQSIEDIFAGIPPLTEDKPIDLTKHDEVEEAKEEPTPQASTPDSDTDEDVTLSKLAMEFVATQDADGLPPTASAKGGKIGRLKNILPFKKKEKSEPSVLGDLFGWAGVAANDDADSFAMPDFFAARH